MWLWCCRWLPCDYPTARSGLSRTWACAAQLWRVPRYGLKTAGAAAAPLLQTLAQALPAWFERSLQAAVLYMAAEVVKIFGRDASHHAVLGAPPHLRCHACL